MRFHWYHFESSVQIYEHAFVHLLTWNSTSTSPMVVRTFETCCTVPRSHQAPDRFPHRLSWNLLPWEVYPERIHDTTHLGRSNPGMTHFQTGGTGTAGHPVVGQALSRYFGSWHGGRPVGWNVGWGITIQQTLDTAQGHVTGHDHWA